MCINSIMWKQIMEATCLIECTQRPISFFALLSSQLDVDVAFFTSASVQLFCLGFFSTLCSYLDYWILFEQWKDRPDGYNALCMFSTFSLLVSLFSLSPSLSEITSSSYRCVSMSLFSFFYDSLSFVTIWRISNLSYFFSLLISLCKRACD